MPKKRKPHSKAARDQRLYAGMRAWMWESEPAGEGHEYVLHVQHWMPPFGWCDVTNRRIIDNLFDQPRNWVLCGRALCRTSQSEMWMEQADASLVSRKLLQVEGAYDALRAAVLAANKLDHVFDCGWIAQSWVHKDPAEADPEWVYHDAPLGLARAKVAGEPFSQARKVRWQMANEREKKNV